MFPDRSASIFLELRRRHDNQFGEKSFLVTKRTTFGARLIHNKAFGTIAEARRHWKEEYSKMIDCGFLADELQIQGFHEED